MGRCRSSNGNPKYRRCVDKQPAYAVLRFDDYLGEVEHHLEERVTVVKVVLTVEEAEAEVARLNELNASKGSRYVWQTTRLATRRLGAR